MNCLCFDNSEMGRGVTKGRNIKLIVVVVTQASSRGEFFTTCINVIFPF